MSDKKKTTKQKSKSKSNLSPVRREKRNKIISIIVGVLAVVIVAFYILWSLGIPQRNLTAGTIGQAEFSAVEYNHAFYSIYNVYNQYYGNGGLLNLRDDSSEITGEDKTWQEFISERAETNVKQDNLMYQKALEKGYELTEEDQESIDNQLLQEQMQVGNKVDFEVYLENAFGKGMHPDAYRKIIEKKTLAMKYATDAPYEIEISEDQIEEKYAEDPDLYDVVEYHSFILVTPTTDEEGEALSEEAQQGLIVEQEDLAEDIVAEITGPEDMLVLAKKYAGEEDKKIYDNPIDLTYFPGQTKSNVNNVELQEWLFDEEREAGDVTYVSAGSDFEIVYFLDKYKDERLTADVQFLSFSLLGPNNLPLTPEEQDQIVKEANGLMHSLKTTEDFEKFRTDQANSEDPERTIATISEPMKGITAADSARTVNPLIVNWALSDEVSAGDNTVIKTQDSVYLVLCLERGPLSSRTQQIKTQLQHEAYNEAFSGWLEEEQYQMKKVYPGAFFMKD